MQREKIKSWLTAEQARELMHTPERILEIIYQQIREKAQAGGRAIFVQDFGFDRLLNETFKTYAPLTSYTQTQQLVIDTLNKDRYEVETVWADANCTSCGLSIRW